MNRSRARPSLPAVALATILAVVLTAWMLATPASAHDPIFLTEDQRTPDEGPYLPDGTISSAVYGSLLEPADTRGLEFDLRDGEELYLSLLIPDLEPETLLAEDELPTMTLVGPDGSERAIGPEVREPFADPFSGTDYVTLYETVEPADGGRHQIVVTGNAPTRFVVAVGTKEEFFTPTERSGDRPTTFSGIAAPLNAWYTTPADGSEPVNAEGGADVDVDVELIEDELAKLEEAENTEPDEAAPATEGDGDGASDDGSATWIAPAAVALAVGLGAGVLLRRRRTT